MSRKIKYEFTKLQSLQLNTKYRYFQSSLDIYIWQYYYVFYGLKYNSFVFLLWLSLFFSVWVPLSYVSYCVAPDQAKPDSCHQVHHASRGVIQSPGFPYAYPTDLDCTYVIAPDEAKTVTLMFHRIFELDEQQDLWGPDDFVLVR